MTIVTKQQALDRWDTLPEDLREALYSEANSDFIWSACAKENVSEKMAYTVAQVTGYVLMGFLHSEDMASELVEMLKIDQRTAKDLQDAIIGRIFVPLRADIDKVYSPLSKAAVIAAQIPATPVPAPAPSVGGPKIVQDVNMSITPRPASAMPSMSGTGGSMNASKPTTVSDVGWSKTSAAGPGIRLNTAPTPTAPAPAPKPAVPAAPGIPAPVIIHEDNTFKAIGKNEGFTLQQPGVGAEVRMTPPTPGQSSMPSRPAVIEFGGVKKPTAPAPSKTGTSSQSNAVHYTEFKISLSATPTADSGPRSVSQVTPSQSAPTPTPMPRPAPAPTPTPAPVSAFAPRPASVPVPMPMPRPATAPAPMQSTVPMPRPPQAPPSQPQQQPPKTDKPIVKNFL